MFKKLATLSLLVFFISYTTISQELSPKEIKALIESYKNDVRGPYYRIKWFCKDGTIREPKDPCPDDIGGGIQHASFKESTLKLRNTNHLFFGDILADTDFDSFLDKKNDFSRLKQYQLGKYLASVDDGWVLRKGQYYRGAIQSEDEQAWGKDFFIKLLKDDTFLEKYYYLIRQTLKDIPHNGDTNISQDMRSESKILSDEIPSFMDIRIKIHGKPESSDIKLVENYYQKNSSKISDTQKKEFSKLLKTMKTYYEPIDFKTMANDLESISEKNNTTKNIQNFLNTYPNNVSNKSLLTEISNILSDIRLHILSFKNSENRLKVLDFTNDLELILIKEFQNWKPETLDENLEKISVLACATMGTGLIEPWEYSAIEHVIYKDSNAKELSLAELNDILTVSRSIVEWSASMVKANYQKQVDNYAVFEPLAYGFIDDRVRSSIALNLGEMVSDLGSFVAKKSNINNNVMQISSQSAIRGLNPGYAFGELVVVDGNPDAVEVNTSKIYIFEKPPSDLKPVAGIMTVSEGNLVSHVQLLARNLGIPNAALSYNNLKELKPYSGKNVFLAVSNKGNVILKSEANMSSEEKALFSKKERSKNVIAVPVDQIRLDVSKVINMRDVDAKDSGKLCGPKAANLGELKKLFPEQVVEGLIIPFGIFRTHMNQNMPNENKTYWNYLNDTFIRANELRASDTPEQEVENFQLIALEKLHKAMLDIDLDPAFVKDLKGNFKSVFGDEIGNVPVFLRSDTNMEDLKEFTGAGLNLTLFNIREEEKIIEGIKRVWASAYTERSFKWRQKYLSNPENVFPSILIIPSVDVDYSGVMITKGINTGNDDDLTVAFSRGAGGAVDGQSAETRLITSNSNILLAPARQADYIRLPDTGGTKYYMTAFNEPILNEENIEDIKALTQEIRKTIGTNSETKNQAYDVEFGFKDNKLWLFQIRPFVENKQAKSSDYLASISPKIDTNKKIKLTENI